jgi:hypothetical protein
LALTATEFIQAAQPFLIKEEETDEWFGTKLLGDKAWVYTFRLCPEAITLVAEASLALFSWLQPDLPEDLCFVRFDGTPWLVSISHERDGYFLISDAESEAFPPNLLNLVRKS